MLKHVKDREEEELLLKWCVDTAPFYKQLIEDLENQEDIIKPNGEVHKGKQKIRLGMIRDLKKELKVMKEFYIKRKVAPEKWSSNRYSIKRGVNEYREHLRSREDSDMDARVQHS